ncbi:MAG: tetraacyldisaccharide 4'-kinase [Parachlamydiales bacterium]
MSRLEGWWLEAIKGERRPLLRLLSWGYGAGVALRNWAYDAHLLKTHPSPLPTISVGNILIGGSGKTPLVRYIAQHLPGKVAILTRGYRSRAEKRRRPTLVRPTDSWEEVGDEPLMLARSLPNALVIVCADRVRGAAFAKELGAERLILDDGFQHRRLSRDLDLVCAPPPEARYLFPRGPLREPRSSLKRADQVVELTLTASVAGQEIRGKRVALYCGIARPERFFNTVRDLGAEIVATLSLPDHTAPTLKQIQTLRNTAPDLLLCTEKDWVKGEWADTYLHLEVTPLTTLDLSL